MMFFFLMIRRPPSSTRTDTLFPSRRSSDLLQRQFADQPALLGHGDEAFGRDQSIFGRFPAHQHFETDQPPARDVDLRFEMRNELAARHAFADAGLALVDRKSTSLNSSH